MAGRVLSSEQAKSAIQQVQGIWTVFDSSMANTLDKTRTDLAVEKVGYNVGLSEAAFSRRELESGQ